MITMKGFFLFIVINVFVWNTVVYAGEDKMEIADNIYELDVIVGEYKPLKEYKGKMLIISNLFTNMELEKNYSNLIHLAKKYNKFGLRVIAIFGDQFNNTETEKNEDSSESKDELKRSISDLMKENEIEIIYGYAARSLWKSMNNDPVISFQLKIFEGRVVYHTFVIERNGRIIEGYFKEKNSIIFFEIVENVFIWMLKPWNYTESVYGLVVENCNTLSVSMEQYRNKVLIVSFIDESSKFQSLLQLADNYNNENLKILVILATWVMKRLEDELINKINAEAKVHIFKDNNSDSVILRKFCQLKIQGIEESRKTLYINNFFINKEGNITEFKGTKKEIDKMLEEHILNPDQIVP